LGAGEFSWEDTILTFQCLGIFSLSLFAQSVIPLLARTFYAMQNTKIPFYVALVSEGVAILTVITLIGKYKILSLAIAFSLASLVQMFLLLFILRFKHENLDDNRIINFIFKIVVASFFGGVVVQLFKYLIASIVNMNTFIGVFTQLIVASFFGGVVFLLVCHLIKMEEFNNFKDSLTRKIFKMKKIIIEESANEVSGIK
jgi:putative peptidoglycan lipid II flippase